MYFEYQLIWFLAENLKKNKLIIWKWFLRNERKKQSGNEKKSDKIWALGGLMIEMHQEHQFVEIYFFFWRKLCNFSHAILLHSYINLKTIEQTEAKKRQVGDLQFEIEAW